jgi:putative tricarboxylic transport membrane protein
MSMETAPEEKPSARLDLVTAAAWVAVASGIVVGSWTMDRLERLGAPLYSAPGLVPGLLGLVLLALGVVLGVRAVRAAGLDDPRVNPSLREGWRGTALVLALCLGYAVGLVGHVPFWLATFLFVTAFIAIFEYPSLRSMAMAPVYGAGTSLAVTWLFESVFLVRLP